VTNRQTNRIEVSLWHLDMYRIDYFEDDHHLYVDYDIDGIVSLLGRLREQAFPGTVITVHMYLNPNELQFWWEIDTRRI
jgi:hypothetical protein